MEVSDIRCPVARNVNVLVARVVVTAPASMALRRGVESCIVLRRLRFGKPKAGFFWGCFGLCLAVKNRGARGPQDGYS